MVSALGLYATVWHYVRAREEQRASCSRLPEPTASGITCLHARRDACVQPLDAWIVVALRAHTTPSRALCTNSCFIEHCSPGDLRALHKR